MPTSYVIQRYGCHPGWVALTFDDGPDGRWTPKILDILKAKHAPATFFVIGKNMQPQPGPGAARGARGPRRSAATPGPTPTSPRCRRPQTDAGAERHPAAVRGASPAGPCACSGRPIFGDAEPSTPREVEPLLIGPEAGLPDRRPAHRPGRLEAPGRHDPGADRQRRARPADATPDDRPGQVSCCTTPAATAAARSRPCRS